jgi:Ser-Thr-rich glycosyl-phosphatidyl-inositol-anchored membrane family
MSMLERVKTALQGVDVVPSRPGPGLGLATDRVLVTEPRTGVIWQSGEQVRVCWALTAAAEYPLTVTLVRINGVMAEDIAVLAGGVDPKALAVAVTVPATDPGADYAVSVTSADPTSVYSQTFTIAV